MVTLRMAKSKKKNIQMCGGPALCKMAEPQFSKEKCKKVNSSYWK